MNATLSLLDDWVQHNWLRRLDMEFARFLSKQVPSAHPLMILAAALTSHQLGCGHVCLDLDATLNNPLLALSLPPESRANGTSKNLADPLVRTPADILAHVSLDDWFAALENPLLISSGSGNTPLVKIGSRLYLRRYWQYEQDVHLAISQRLQAGVVQNLDTSQIHDLLTVLFKDKGDLDPDWQRLACALAVGRNFSVITGGPGTGKTTTVVTLLALLQVLALSPAGDPATPPRALRIRLAAPTGKAAARLSSSIANELSKLPWANLGEHAQRIKESIPHTVTTLHRLLGALPNSRHFRHNARKRLPLDILVVDEASMVDLEMMASLLAAVPSSARIILLGDKDQLASVEAGAVLGQLCYRAAAGHYTPEHAHWLTAASGHAIPNNLIDLNGSQWDQAVVMLRHSFRFAADSGIGRLAKAVNAGDADAVAEIARCNYQGLVFISEAKDAAVFSSLILRGGIAEKPCSTVSEPADGYQYYLHKLHALRPQLNATGTAFDQWANLILQAHAQFQVLCALRAGPWGVEGLNQRIAEILHKNDLISSVNDWYVGRPVMVTRNDYGLGLMNGDIGITLEVPTDTGDAWVLKVAFPSSQAQGEIKWVLPSRLQQVQTVYALTVHKSQGSEFNHVVLVMPETPNPILTRELLYTGITRARNQFTLFATGPSAILHNAIQRQVLRTSGLLKQHAV